MTAVKRAIGFGLVLSILGVLLRVVGTILTEEDVEAASGIEGFGPWLGNIGIIIVIVTLILALRPGGILRKEQVVDNWSALIEDAQGRAEAVFEDTEHFLKESKAPNLKIERRSMAPGLFRSILGNERDFLITTETGNSRLRPYQLFLNARDYGNNLDVAWYLTSRPTFLQSMLSLIPFINLLPTGPADLDLFDQQDLRAYTTPAHRATLTLMNTSKDMKITYKRLPKIYGSTSKDSSNKSLTSNE